jgi:YegS/Rv2252/BmrU family lipid kinase
MSVETVHLFLNPAAGRGRAGKRAARICELLGARGAPVELHLSSAVGDLEKQIQQHVQDGARRVVVAGGDGSIHEATNGIMNADGNAALGVIPTGTGNDFAKASDIPLDWEQASLQLAERMASSREGRQVDVGCMNDRYFANGAGIGFDAKVTKIARSYRLPIGDLVYLFAIFRGMIDGIATPSMRLTAGRKIWDGPITLANVANGSWVGGMFHIAPMADNGDGTFDLVIAGPVSRFRIFSLLPMLMSGKHFGQKEIIHEPVSSLEIEADDPVLSHLDGEIQPPQRHFSISLLPGALRLL